MNRIILLGLSLVLSASVLVGQVIEESLTPKTPPKKSGKAKLPDPATPPPNPEDDVQVVDKLLGIVIVKSKEEVKRDGLEAVTGLEVRDVPVLAGPKFAAVVEPYFGQPATIRTLKEIQRRIVIYCREQDRPLVDVVVPNQEVKNGVVQLVLIEGRIGNVTVRNDDPKWFRDGIITQGIRATSGDVVKEKQLLTDINWVNRNPFREVSLAFKQGDRPGL